MKHVSLFNDFLRDTVNLNQTRIDRLNSNVDALKNFVRQCDWGPTIRRFEAQGSWAHETIIKPVDGKEFDADLLVLVNPVTGWSASDYIAELGRVFEESGVYGAKADIWDYCVTITYTGDRKVDIAPCVLGRAGTDSLEVCNRPNDAFEASEPLLYTTWLKERNSYSGSNSFRKVTRLLKYLRDIKTRFTCPSVLLTTLLGYQIEFWDKDSEEFADTPTTLRTVVGRLDNWLQARPSKPRVQNPKLPSEDFAARWTDGQYNNFRTVMHRYRGWIDEAYAANDRDASIAAWRRLFGSEFAKGYDVTVAKSLSEDTSLLPTLLRSTAAHLDALVDVVRRYGVSILPAAFNTPPHMQAPQWRRLTSVSSNVIVSATWHAKKQNAQGSVVGPGQVLKPDGGVWFDVHVNQWEDVPSTCSVHWRITNTGAAALALNQGRGGFYPPTVGNRRWEALLYRGVHIAEAFVVRRADSVLVGQSAPFHVVIE